MEADMILDKATCVAIEALHEEFAATLAFRLEPQARLALWALLHQAGDIAWLPWQAAKTPEQALAIFRSAFEEAYCDLVGSLDFEPQAGEPANAKFNLVTMPEPEPAA
jgi:hypothetical protein